MREVLLKFVGRDCFGALSVELVSEALFLCEGRRKHATTEALDGPFLDQNHHVHKLHLVDAPIVVLS